MVVIDEIVLTTILKAMKMKMQNKWSNKSFDDNCEYIKQLLPLGNKYPDSYQSVRKILKSMGLGYEIIHACENGSVLFYKENAHRDNCPLCEESRWIYSECGKRVPVKVVRYFPLTPRLQCLYMSPHTAKKMRWHGEMISDPDFHKSFQEFANDIRNVRLILATDGFNPFGATGLSHSTWPVVAMPYNLSHSMCMKNELNILVLLISGPKSPGKCLNVFMRPFMDELKMLWSTRVRTYDRHEQKSFIKRAALMWTISDFPGLGMLGDIQTKGYKACPLCLEDVDSNSLTGRMAYQGHCKWLPRMHPWRRAANKFNGEVELREAPRSWSGDEIYSSILSHDYPVVSLHHKFKSRATREKLC